MGGFRLNDLPPSVAELVEGARSGDVPVRAVLVRDLVALGRRDARAGELVPRQYPALVAGVEGAA